MLSVGEYHQRRPRESPVEMFAEFDASRRGIKNNTAKNNLKAGGKNEDNKNVNNS